MIRDGNKMISTGKREHEKILAGKVYRDYCASLPWQDRPTRTMFAKQGRKPEAEALVYFISCDAPGYPVKIGTTRSLHKRVSAIQGTTPFPVKVLATHPGDRSLEMRLHEIFRADRLEGEWFKRSNDLMQIIEEIG